MEGLESGNTQVMQGEIVSQQDTCIVEKGAENQCLAMVEDKAKKEITEFALPGASALLTYAAADHEGLELSTKIPAAVGAFLIAWWLEHMDPGKVGEFCEKIDRCVKSAAGVAEVTQKFQ